MTLHFAQHVRYLPHNICMFSSRCFIWSGDVSHLKQHVKELGDAAHSTMAESDLVVPTCNIPDECWRGFGARELRSTLGNPPDGKVLRNLDQAALPGYLMQPHESFRNGKIKLIADAVNSFAFFGLPSLLEEVSSVYLNLVSHSLDSPATITQDCQKVDPPLAVPTGIDGEFIKDDPVLPRVKTGGDFFAEPADECALHLFN